MTLPTRKTILSLTVAVTLIPALSACGYHRIGTQAAPAREESAAKPTPTRVVPKRDEAFKTASSYFPLREGAVFTYARSYVGGASAGTRVMTVSAAGDTESFVNNRLEVAGQMFAMQTTGRVGHSDARFTVALPGFPNVHTLQSFTLKNPLKAHAAWDAELDGRAWNFAVRPSQRVSVPAGDYDCLVVEGTARSSSLSARQHTKQTLHFAPGVGLVMVTLTIDEQREHEVVHTELVEALVSIQ